MKLMKFNTAEWRLAYEIAWDDPWFKWQTIATCAIVMLAIAFYLVRLIPVGVRNSALVFHYNLYLGIDDVRPWPWVFAAPAYAIAAIGADIVASLIMYRHDRIASRVLLSAATVFSILAGIGAIFIILKNG
jgi:hypothetical protein